jgi:hypothetical protein
MARQAVMNKVAHRVRPLARGYVERWILGEFSLVDGVARRHENEIRAWKDVVAATMVAITVDELLRVCRETRPDLADLWGTEGARRRLAEEWRKAHAWVRTL